MEDRNNMPTSTHPYVGSGEIPTQQPIDDWRDEEIDQESSSWWRRVKTKGRLLCLTLIAVLLFLTLHFAHRDPNKEFQLLGRPLSGSYNSNGFGNRLALSGDGNILVTSASQTGGIFIYEWSGSKWKDIGQIPYNFEHAEVATDYDGQRIAIASYYCEWVIIYERNGEYWLQAGSTIVPANGQANHVAMSEDGSRIALGTLNAGDVSATVEAYDFDGSDWTQVGSTLETDGMKGLLSLDLAGDGSRMAVVFLPASGSYYYQEEEDYSVDSPDDIIEVYDWNGDDWAQQESVFSSPRKWGAATTTLALSSDGSRLVIGDSDDDSASQVKVYGWSGEEWAQVGETLSINTNNSMLHADGYYVAISSSGDRVIARTNRSRDFKYHVLIFDWTGSSWEKVGNGIQLKGSHYLIGTGIAASADGTRIATAGQPLKAWGECKVRVYDQAI